MELDALQRAELADGYRLACSRCPLNRAARQGQTYDLASISSAAAESLRNAVAAVPLCSHSEFVIMDPTADGGMPHTRAPNLICLPATLCTEGPASASFLETLAHEAIHVHQRRNAALWRQSLLSAGWTPADPATLPPAVASRLRINPDTMAAPLWAWESRHIPLPLFEPKVNPGLGDIRLQWLDQRTGALFPFAPPTFPQQGNASVLEHPYELYAYRLSQGGVRDTEALEEALRDLE